MKTIIKNKIEKLRLENSKLSTNLYTRADREQAKSLKKIIKSNERKMDKLFLELKAVNK